MHDRWGLDRATFVKGALSVQVSADCDFVKVTPTSNHGAHDGFDEIQVERRSPKGPSSQGLGTVIGHAIATAR